MDRKPIKQAKIYASDQEKAAYRKIISLFAHCPIPDNEILANFGLFLTRASLARILFLHKLYLQALHTPGVIFDFGVRWGNNMGLFTSLRNIYEPYNISRKIIGFDTFEGFPTVSVQDADAKEGDLSVTANYELWLEEILQAQEQLSPRAEHVKHTLVKGDVCSTLPYYLEQHPETIISMAYFDFDLYKPTKMCLEAIKPHLVKNSVIGFDQLALEEFPGETQAFREAWGLNDFELIRDPTVPQQTYLVFGGN